MPNPYRPHTLNSTSTSKSFQSTVTGELNAPYSKQFVHSKSSQYRKMKTEWKSNVYLARSRIQVSSRRSKCRLNVSYPCIYTYSMYIFYIKISIYNLC